LHLSAEYSGHLIGEGMALRQFSPSFVVGLDGWQPFDIASPQPRSHDQK